MEVLLTAVSSKKSSSDNPGAPSSPLATSCPPGICYSTTQHCGSTLTSLLCYIDVWGTPSCCKHHTLSYCVGIISEPLVSYKAATSILYLPSSPTTWSIWWSSAQATYLPCLTVCTEPSMSTKDLIFHDAKYHTDDLHLCFVLCAMIDGSISEGCKPTLNEQVWHEPSTISQYPSCTHNSCTLF